jgi:hypothetical protein
MADREQLDILRQGVKVWNEWRAQQPQPIFIDLYNANLSSANLIGIHLSRADLSKVNFCNSNLSSADLSFANLRYANLNNARLSSASLREANLSGTHLINARLNYTNLISADLRDANLNDANLSKAIVGRTIFGNLDLRSTKGLEFIEHAAPSTVGTDTLERSQGKIPEQFLEGAGVSNTLIEYAHSLFNNSVEYYTCFISYSSKDEFFATRLHNDLQQEGVRCWFAPEDMAKSSFYPLAFATSFCFILLFLFTRFLTLRSLLSRDIRCSFPVVGGREARHSTDRLHLSSRNSCQAYPRP